MPLWIVDEFNNREKRPQCLDALVLAFCFDDSLMRHTVNSMHKIDTQQTRGVELSIFSIDK